MKAYGFFFVFATLLIAAPADAADSSLPQALATLKSLTPGAAAPAAQAAWRFASEAPAAELPTLLAALDDATPVGANWIGTAIDAVKERGGKSSLPSAELERFVLDRSHAPRGRRIGYEILTAADPAVANRLLPRMLDDPSVELRREAVAAVLKQADELTGQNPNDKRAIVAAYQQAFAAARDQDQIDRAVERLKKFGEQVDLPRHYGFVTAWRIAGPYANVDKQGLLVSYPPEQKLDDAALHWTDYTTTDDFGQVDLNKALGKHMSVAGYALAEFRSAEDRTVQIRIGTENAFRLWVNGRLLQTSEVYHSFSGMDQFTVPVKLAKGNNVILMKICQNNQKEDWAQGWQFQLRVCDATGTAVAPSK